MRLSGRRETASLLRRALSLPWKIVTIAIRLPITPRTITVAVSAVVLVWLVVTRSFAAYFADAAPRAALWLDSHQPEALVNLADRGIRIGGSGRSMLRQPANGSVDPAAKGRPNLDQDFALFETLGRDQSTNRPIPPDNEPAVRRWAQTALTKNPLDARALRILGQLAEADGNDADAAKFMRTAGELSLHENGAAYWLLRNSMRTNDYQSAIYYADVLLRTETQSDALVVPVLARISEDKAGEALVKAKLAGNPPWRERFFSLLPNSVRDARVPLDLLLSLRTDPLPPRPEDINAYVNFLVAHNFFKLAYYTWLQFLTPEELQHAGLLFNGNFEGPLSGLPFDWTITSGAGVTVDIVPKPDKSGGHALMVDFQIGRVEYRSVTELVMLTPGTYQFKGEYKGQLIGPRGLKWRVVCAGGPVTKGGESDMILGEAKNWRTLAFTFTVPDKDCAAQYVRLDLDARMASEQLISGSVLFDDLQISRVTGSATAPTSGG